MKGKPRTPRWRATLRVIGLNRHVEPVGRHEIYSIHGHPAGIIVCVYDLCMRQTSIIGHKIAPEAVDSFCRGWARMNLESVLWRKNTDPLGLKRPSNAP